MRKRYIMTLPGFRVVFLFAAVLILSPCLYGQSNSPVFQNDISSGPTPWTHKPFHNDPDNFQFAIVSDRTGYKRDGVFERAVQDLNLMQPEFVMCVGDQVEGYHKKAEDVENMWDEFEAIVNALEMPYFHVPGNHDLSNETMLRVWNKRFGPAYYYFVYKDVLFLVLDTEDPPISQDKGIEVRISQEQVNYFLKVLDTHQDVRWTCVFLHEPCWTPSVHPAWATIEDHLKSRPYTVFSGHWHHYNTYTRQGRNYYVLATTGGISKLEGPAKGEMDHFMWVTMTDQGPRISNILVNSVFGPDGGQKEGGLTPAALNNTLSCTCAPFFYKGKSFKEGTASFSLENRGPSNTHATISFIQHPSLQATPAIKELDIPARKSETFQVTIKNMVPGKHPALPLRSNVIFSCAIDGQPSPVRFTRALSIMPVKLNSITPARTPVQVDGHLDEWGKLPFVCKSPGQIQFSRALWSGPDDASFHFGVHYDTQYLYIGIRVKDDDLFLKQGQAPWFQDAVEVRLDARPEPARSTGKGEKEFSNFLVISMSPGQNQDQAYRHEKLPRELKAVSRATSTGHETEIAVPVSYLNKMQKKKWEAIRLNIAIDDYDHADQAHAQKGQPSGTQIWWQPDWRTPENITGSGTFIH